jgi:glycosyltransferase involved in cell wall biosynthesis
MALEDSRSSIAESAFHAFTPQFVDRYQAEKKGIDVLLLTLDAELFLERSLYSLYSEVPVARLIVCDGGSHDRTISILSKFPRVQLHVRPDIRTTGKSVEFLLSKAETEWIMFTDGDLTYPKGWYDEMCKYRDKYDAIDSRRVHAYEFYREDRETELINERPLLTTPQLGKRKALKKFIVDDDYMWRITDIAVRQAIEKGGYRYGKITSTFHFHHTGEGVKYASDPSKVYLRVIFEDPKVVIVNQENYSRTLVQAAKAYVKYIDPNLPYVKGVDHLLLLLDRQWVAENGPAWLTRYDKARTSRNRLTRLRRIIRKVLSRALRG